MMPTPRRPTTLSLCLVPPVEYPVSFHPLHLPLIVTTTLLTVLILLSLFEVAEELEGEEHEENEEGVRGQEGQQELGLEGQVRGQQVPEGLQG